MDSEPGMPRIHLDRLTKRYGNVEVLHGIDLEMAEFEKKVRDVAEVLGLTDYLHHKPGDGPESRSRCWTFLLLWRAGLVVLFIALQRMGWKVNTIRRFGDRMRCIPAIGQTQTGNEVVGLRR